MFLDTKRVTDLESQVRQCRDSITTCQREIQLLTSSTDTLIENLRSEWRQYLASIEDERDKMEHIVKRHAKRRSRAQAKEVADSDSGENSLPDTQDPTTAKILARRHKHAIRTENVSG